MSSLTMQFLYRLKKISTKFLLGIKWCFEIFVRLIGPLFVIIASILIGGVIYVHFINSITFYAPYSSLPGVLHLLISIYISFSIGYNYFSAVFVSPGSPPTLEELNLSEAQLIALQDHNLPESAIGPPGTSAGGGSNGGGANRVNYKMTKFCKKCNRIKPERSHHCHVCGKCVLKMDHHCPWVANCVGHRNHHFFVLFIFWLWFGCLYASVMSFIPFTLSSNSMIPFRGSVPRGAVIFSFVIAVAVFVALTIMLLWQIYLIFTSQTTIEFYFNKSAASEASKQGKAFKNPFDLGIANNFQIFFGTRESKYWFSWLVPGGVKVQGDGITYLKNRQTPLK